MAENQEIKRYRVLNLPSTGLISGTNYELYLGGGQYRNYVVNDSNQLVAQDGKEFIECDTVDDLRNLDARQIWAIQNGYYKGVTLNGYYKANDTPAPIQYYLSDTAEEDDGGSVFEVGGIKLKHDHQLILSSKYFGSISSEDTQYLNYVEYVHNKGNNAEIYKNNVDYDLKLTVGDGGMFNDINSALKYASSLYIRYKKVGVKIEILLLSGFVMREQVFLLRTDLSYIIISSEDSEVIVDRSYINEDFSNKVNGWRSGVFPVFTAMENSVMPSINVLFNMNDEGNSSGIVGILIKDGSRCVIHRGKGFKNIPWRGLYLDNGYCYARRTVWDNCGNGTSDTGSDLGCSIRVANNSIINIRDSTFTNTRSAISVADGYVEAKNSTFDGGTVGNESEDSSAINCAVGTVNVENSVFNNFKRYIFTAVSSSKVYANNSEFGSSVDIPVVSSGGDVSVLRCDFLGANIRAIYSGNGSVVNCSNSNINNLSILSQYYGTIICNNCNFGLVYSAFQAQYGGVIKANGSVVNSTGSRYASISNNSYIDLTGVRTNGGGFISNDMHQFNYKSNDGEIIYDIPNNTVNNNINSLLTASSGSVIRTTTNFTSNRIFRLPNIIGRFRFVRESSGNYPLNIANSDGSVILRDLYLGEYIDVVNQDGTTWSITNFGNDTSLHISNETPQSGFRVGSMIYRTDINKPIYKKSNTEWVDATGTVV